MKDYLEVLGVMFGVGVAVAAGIMGFKITWTLGEMLITFLQGM